MAATTNQLNALANDGVFRQRCRTLVLQICAQVYGEGTGVTNHAARAAFAVKLLQAPNLADQLVSVIVTRTNIAASAVTYDFDKGEVLTDATDAAILSQIATDWSMLAGV
jgi:hypothetical protein